jgi:uncharacterized protein with von Willebrand factor type A (vWA) domain
MPSPEGDTPGEDPGGRLPGNLLRFGRLLRQVGIPVSTLQVSDLARSLEWVNLERREDVYHAARCNLLNDARQIELFDRAFDFFWSGRVELLIEMGYSPAARRPSGEMLPESDQPAQKAARHLQPPAGRQEEPPDPQETGLLSSYSPLEILYHKDFAHFSEEELLAAQQLIRSMSWKLAPRRTRRTTRSSRRTARLDMRRVMRENLSLGEELLHLSWRARKTKPRPLVLICDISGSMERYSRLLLQFLYTLVQDNRKIETFVFGTRLTCITPALRRRDAAAAVDHAAGLVVDWSGGTRIGESLKTFNFRWSRRVLGHGAIVLIISDGWDRGEAQLLRGEIRRLKASASRLMWLNPLAGAPDYQPLVRGMQTALPYLDDFLPLNNLSSLEELARQLGALSG